VLCRLKRFLTVLERAAIMTGEGMIRLTAEATVSPTESEIAAVAYQLWVNNGCPAGSDQEDWFRAEAMLKDALVAECEGPSRGASIPLDTRTESQVVVAFRWGIRGHWEVWEK